MKQKTKERLFFFLPWALILAVLVAFTLYGLIYSEGANPYEANFVKIDLLSTMRIHLLEATDQRYRSR